MFFRTRIESESMVKFPITVCDITQSWSPTGGGIRTYIREKQKYVEHHPSFRHILIVPGAEDGVSHHGSSTVYTVAAAEIPGCRPYRFSIRADKVLAILSQEKPRVIEFGSMDLWPWVGFAYGGKQLCTFVQFFHTDFPVAYVEPAVKRAGGPQLAREMRRAADHYVRFLCNRCDCTVTASELLEDRLLDIGVRNVRFLPLGVDLDTFHPTKRDEAFRNSLGLSPDDVLLCYAGRLDSEKRIGVLLDAFSRLDKHMSVFLVLVGEGPLKPAVLEWRRTNPRIRWLPFQPQREDLARILASSDVYVTAGPFETFGLSVVEAQASGLPVIGVRSGALVERVPDSVGCLIAADDSEALAGAMRAMTENGYRRLGRNARRHAEARYSWNRTFDELFRLYHELMFDRFHETPTTAHRFS